jgi:UDP-glucose 4-epimerase
MARRFPLRTRFQRDVGELEGYFDTYSRRKPEVTVTMLRYQPTLGARIDSPLTRYLRQPLVPTQLGFDPLLQFVDADDAVAALEAAVLNPVPGPVNVAGEGSISLSRLLRRARKLALPLPAPVFVSALRAARRLGGVELPPEAVPWLRHGLTIDCTRLVEEIGYRPMPTLEAVRNFIERTSGRVQPPREGSGPHSHPSNGLADRRIWGERAAAARGR